MQPQVHQWQEAGGSENRASWPIVAIVCRTKPHDSAAVSLL